MPGPDLERIKSRMTELLEVFSKAYTKSYKAALIADRREKANGPKKKKNGEPDWKLLVDPSKLIRNPQIEGYVYVGDGLSKKVFWSMNSKYVIVEKKAEEAAAASSPKSASPAPEGEEKEIDSRIWLDDSCSKVCMNPNCGKKFGLTTRRSHCRHCGELFCGDCVKSKIKDDKFCEPCFAKRSVAGSAESQMPPLKEPKNKSKVYNFYNYRVDRLDKSSKEACGKYAVKLSHRREKKPQPIIGFESEKERDQWYNFLYMSKWHAPSPITDDKLLRRAFTDAFVEFRWHAYVWSAWMMDGTESELIAETLYECLERDIFGNDLRALGDMPKKMARNAIEGIFEAGVGTMWSTLQKTIASIRPDLEKSADSMLGPVFDAEQTIKASAKGSIEAPVNAGLEAAESQLQEQFGAQLPNLQAVGTEQLKVIRQIFVDVIAKLEAGEKFDSVHSSLRWEGCWTTDYMQKPVTAHLDELKKSNIEQVKWLAPELIYGLRDLQQSAFYVMKTELLADVKEKDAQTAKLRASAADILTRATADVQAMLHWKLVQALDRTIRSPLMSKIQPVVSQVAAPLAASVPAPVKDIVDPKRTCNEIVNETIEMNENALIRKALAPTQQAVQAEGERLAQDQV